MTEIAYFKTKCNAFVNLKISHNLKVESCFICREILRISIQGGSISSRSEKTALRRQEKEDCIEVCNKGGRWPEISKTVVN